MESITCPNCDARLSESEQLDGWCDTCGKALPPHISAHAAKNRRLERRRAETDRFAGTQTAAAAPVKSPSWSWHW